MDGELLGSLLWGVVALAGLLGIAVGYVFGYYTGQSHELSKQRERNELKAQIKKEVEENKNVKSS